MDTTIVEKYDKSRYNMLIGATVGWGIWFGLNIILPYVHNKPVKLIIVAIGLMGIVLAVVSYFRMVGIKKVIKKHPELGLMLNNEWVIHTKRQAIAIGYWSMLMIAAIGIGITSFIVVSGFLLMQIVLFTGIQSMLIAHLVLLRGK